MNIVLFLLACVSLTLGQWTKIITHTQSDKLIAKSGKFGIFFSQNLDVESQLSLHLEVKNLVTLQTVFESDPDFTPLTLAHHIEFHYSRFIYQGYSLTAGFSIHKRKVNSIKGYQLLEQGTQLHLFIETEPIGDFTTEGMLKIRFREDSISMSFIVTKAPNRVNQVSWGFKAKDQQEGLYGFGMRMVPEQNKRGRKKFYSYNEEGGFGFGTEFRLPKGHMSSHMPIPFFLSSGTGMGYLLNTTYRCEFDLDYSTKGHYIFTVQSPEFQFILYTGSTPAQSLSLYTKDTGRALIPPLFQFGPQNMFYNEFYDISVKHENHYDAALEAWDRFIDLDIPSSVCIDQTRFLPTGDQRGWQEQIKRMNKVMKELGLYTTAYTNARIDTRYQPLYSELSAQHLLVRRNDGSIYTFYAMGADKQAFRVSIFDFTNPNALPYWNANIQKIIDFGYSGFMLDYGEYVDPQNIFYNGKNGKELHNEYTNIYHQVTFDYLTSLEPERLKKGYAPDFIFYPRSGSIGTAKNTWIHWTGDPQCNFSKHSGMPAQLSGIISAGLTGVPFMGSDIGGYEWTFSTPSKQLWIRWAQLGAFSGTMHTQTHGTPIFVRYKSHIHDWEEGTWMYRKLAKIRMQLLPYLYDAAHEARATGLPMMRHLLLMFPHDKEAISQDFQYMLGEKILVAPVVEEFVTGRDVYLPEGEDWYFLNGDSLKYRESDGRFTLTSNSIVNGGQHIYIDSDLSDLPPIAVKAGSVVPLIDASVDTVRDSQNQRIVPLAKRKHLLYLWLFPSTDRSVPFQRADGVQIMMLQTQNGNYVELKDRKENNRILVLQILMNLGKQQQFITVKQATYIEEVQTFLKPENSIPKQKNSVLFHFNEDTQVLWVRLKTTIDQYKHFSIIIGGEEDKISE